MNTPKAELEQRLRSLQNSLRQRSIDAALILQRVDLFYFSGTFQAALYIPVDDDPVLMVNKNTERARAESFIETILHLESPKSIPAILKTRGYKLPHSLGLELDVLRRACLACDHRLKMSRSMSQGDDMGGHKSVSLPPEFPHQRRGSET